jgi:hypothetical protein
LIGAGVCSETGTKQIAVRRNSVCNSLWCLNSSTLVPKTEHRRPAQVQ